MNCPCRCHQTAKEISKCSCCCAPVKHEPPCCKPADKEPCCSPSPCQECCGDPDPLGLTPEGPRPGWRPGRAAAASPWRADESDEQRWRRFPGVLLDEVVRGRGKEGPVFGKRKDEWLPYLVIRNGPGDNGQRPWAGSFWESPDIFVASGVRAESAPLVPTNRGGTVVAGQPTTLWAHVWNLGRAPVANARVEFYWCNPSLGISTQSANFIGAAYVDLGARDSGRCHTFVKCPVTWLPQYLNGGHECLVVRFFEPLTDALPRPGWQSAFDRHVGQRNIAVIEAASPACTIVPLRLGCSIGPGKSRLIVERVSASSVAWLALLNQRLGKQLRDAGNIKELIGLLPVTVATSPEARMRPSLDALREVAGLLRRSITVERICDELETQVVVEVTGLESGECAIYQITQQHEGRIAGGYTVITYRI